MKARAVRCATWLAALLFAARAVVWAQAPPAKRVLMLYGHDPNAPGAVAFTNALQAIAFYWLAVGVLTLVATLTVLSPAL